MILLRELENLAGGVLYSIISSIPVWGIWFFFTCASQLGPLNVFLSVVYPVLNESCHIINHGEKL